MIRTLLLFLFAATLSASAQTGLYKRYASRQNLQAYCVERYPLSSGDSVCVTLLQTDDSTVYRTLLEELHKLPYAPKEIRKKSKEASGSLSRSMTKEELEATASIWREHKHLVSFNVDGLEGDHGYYAIYCPSDRMVVLAFLVADRTESLKITRHMISTELEQ